MGWLLGGTGIKHVFCGAVLWIVDETRLLQRLKDRLYMQKFSLSFSSLRSSVLRCYE